MSRGVSSSASSTTFALQVCKIPTSSCQLCTYKVTPGTASPCSSTLKLEFGRKRFLSSWGSPNLPFRCHSSVRPGGSGSGPGGNRSVLDAFFLGKALAETINERVESVVGEFLSTIGRLQAEQQKQVQDFQEEVLEKAKRAKEKAAREALEAQGLVPKANVYTMPVTSRGSSTTNGVSSSTSLADQSTSASETEVNSEATTDNKSPIASSGDN